MLLSDTPQRSMGGRHLPAGRTFPQWSNTAILTIAGHDDVVAKVKKSPPESSNAGFSISGDPMARVAHLEHSVRFLQEQHRAMLLGLHTEIEVLRERNRDLQFQLIFNKETKVERDEVREREEARRKVVMAQLEKEVTEARGNAMEAEAKVDALQKLVNMQAKKLSALELKSCESCGDDGLESKAMLRARLDDAEQAARRLRADGERARREVSAGVTNLLFDDAAARHAHLQCMKNSLQISLRSSGLEPGLGFHNSYHFPPVPNSDFWREPLRDDYNVMGSRNRQCRMPLTLPEVTANGQIRRSTIYVNHYARPKNTAFEPKVRKAPPTNNENLNLRTEDGTDRSESSISMDTKLYPSIADIYNRIDELRFTPEITVRQVLPPIAKESNVPESSSRSRPKRHHNHRKQANADYT